VSRNDDDYEYDDYDEDFGREGSRRWLKLAAGGLLIAGIAAAGFFVLRSNDTHAEFDTSAAAESTTVGTSGGSTTTGSSPTTTDRVDASGTTDGPGTQDRPMSAPGSTGDGLPAESPASTTATTDTPATTDAPTSTAMPTTTTEPAVASEAPMSGDYPKNPDGTPLPAIVIFDTDTITITGMLPSQAAKDKLAFLAKANSQFEDAVVVNNVIVNTSVPDTVGVRVIELNSARFPEGTADIKPAHATELARVANVMIALPNVTVLVIGHADQRGSDAANFAISDERARAVVNYLRYLGVSAARLTSRAAGASDLLTLDNDDAAFALNRRTEFVFYGLFVE
jgi:outer membrane protein OmpA-like peptidoglycan-associated protein